MDTLHQVGQTIALISADQPRQSARFDVRERPVLLEADFCHWDDGYQLMRVVRICGNRLFTRPHEINGKPAMLNHHTARLVVNEPGKYVLVSLTKLRQGAAFVFKTTLGIQHA